MRIFLDTFHLQTFIFNLKGTFKLYLGCYRSELIVTEEVELPSFGVTAEVKGLIPINCKSQNTQEEHADGAKKQGVELTNHSWRPELQNENSVYMEQCILITIGLMETFAHVQ